MSTRSVIARPTKSGFAGRYHHWNGSPSDLGVALYDAYHGHFQRDFDAMCRFLLDDHPAGFSTIVGRDLSLPCGFSPRGIEEPEPRHPECYCHGKRSEEPQELTEQDAARCCLYAYVLFRREGRPLMRVLANHIPAGYEMFSLLRGGHRYASWREIDLVDLEGSVPDRSRTQ